MMTKHVIDDLEADPILIPHAGRLQWLYPSGRLMPLVRGGDGDDDEKKFTQADVDRVVEDRLKRERAKAPEPPADYNDLKTKAKAYDDLEAKNKTEVERLTAANAKLQKDLDEATTKGAKAGENLAVEKKRNAVYSAANDAKALKPDQIFALLPPDAVTISDDGKVTGADKAVESFLKDNPHYVGATTTRRPPAPDTAQGSRGDAKGIGDAGRAEAAKRFPQTAAAGAGQQK